VSIAFPLSLFLQQVVTENSAASLLGPFIKQRKLMYFLCLFMAYLTTPSLAQALLYRHSLLNLPAGLKFSPDLYVYISL